MAAGVTVDTSSNPWVITFAASAAAGFTLPFKLWPAAGYAGPVSPFIVQRAVWIIGNTGAAGNEIIITDVETSPTGPNTWLDLVATGADFMPPQEWKRGMREGAPYGAIITQFDAGTLYLYL